MNSRLNFVWLSNTPSPQRNISGILVPRPPRGVALPGDVGQWQCHGGSRQVSCGYPELPDTQGLSQTPCQLPGTLTAKAQGLLLICRQDWPLWAGFAVDSIIPLDQLEASWSSAHALLVVTPAEENFWSWGCTKAVSDPWATQSSWNSQTQCTPDDWMRVIHRCYFVPSRMKTFERLTNCWRWMYSSISGKEMRANSSLAWYFLSDNFSSQTFVLTLFSPFPWGEVSWCQRYLQVYTGISEHPAERLGEVQSSVIHCLWSLSHLFWTDILYNRYSIWS